MAEMARDCFLAICILQAYLTAGGANGNITVLNEAISSELCLMQTEQVCSRVPCEISTQALGSGQSTRMYLKIRPP
ncbi:hypothetical protein HD554DRAFT_2049965 [Boletus coccyginus]|nr:hypothetical protein HD554DRAFT_2049965 [Boletus coccyginus]